MMILKCVWTKTTQPQNTRRKTDGTIEKKRQINNYSNTPTSATDRIPRHKISNYIEKLKIEPTNKISLKSTEYFTQHQTT